MSVAIIKNIYKENMRNKTLIIAGVAILLLLLFFGSGNSTVMIAGEEMTGITNLLPIFLIVGSVVCSLSAIFLSSFSIPKEYERKNSYLIWSRNISQAKYHTSVATGNLLVSAAITFLFYLSCAILIAIKGRLDLLSALPVSFIITLIMVASVSFISSALSVVLFPSIASIITSVILILGLAKSLLSTLVSTLSGGASFILRFLVRIIPDFYKLASQANNFIQNGKIHIHTILLGALLIYTGIVLLHLLCRKEA